MKRVIYKYEFKSFGIHYRMIPEGGRVLCADSQQETPCVWVLCDPDKPKEEVKFFVVGTGAIIEKTNLDKYVGTVLTHGDNLVCHILH